MAKLLSTAQAAAYAGLPAATLRQWVKAGTLRVVPSGGKGGRWRFRPEAVDAALRANERALATPATSTAALPATAAYEPADDLERELLAEFEAVIAGTKR